MDRTLSDVATGNRADTADIEHLFDQRAAKFDDPFFRFHASGQIDPMLEIPSALFYLPVPIGAGLMTLAFLQVAMKALDGTDRSDGAA